MPPAGFGRLAVNRIPANPISNIAHVDGSGRAVGPSRRKKPLNDVDQKPDPAKRGDGDGNQIDHLEEAAPHALPTSAHAIRSNDRRVLKLLPATARYQKPINAVACFRAPGGDATEMAIANASARTATNAGPYDLMTHSSLPSSISSETFKMQGESPSVSLLAQAKNRPKAVILRRASDIATK